jgi:acid phosphatase family membrane protein YuiD
MIAMPSNPFGYQSLVKLVDAFDAKGQPSKVLEKPRGRLVSAISRATAGLEGMRSVIVAIATISAIVIVWTMFALHKIHWTSIPHYMP